MKPARLWTDSVAVQTRKTVSWNICGICNYRCSYCAQGKRHEGEPDRLALEKTCAFLARLGPGWEVKISGGEPFLFGHLFFACLELVKAGLLVSVVTNFSFALGTYQDFVKLCGDKLRVVSLSYHAEYVPWEDFFAKCLLLKEYLSQYPQASLVVNSVVRPGKVMELLPVKRGCQEKGLRFYPQLEHHRGAVEVYGPEDRQAIESLVGKETWPASHNAGFSFRGKLCYAGVRYLVLDSDGEGYCCYPAKRSREGSLGNAVRGDLRLRDSPAPCPYDLCPCSVPLHRGMVES